MGKDRMDWDHLAGLPTASIEMKAIMLRNRIEQVAVRRRLAGKGWGLSQSGLRNILEGLRPVTPKKLNWLCDVLECTEDERYRVNEFAARDRGYRIGWVHRAHRKPPGMLDPRLQRTRTESRRNKVKAPGYKIGTLRVSYTPIFMNGGTPEVQMTATGIEQFPVYPESKDE